MKNGYEYVYQITFSMKCVCIPRRIRHLCSTESLVCVSNTLGCLFNSPSSAPSSCWWWSLLIMEPENTRHSFPTLSVAKSWAWEPVEANGQEGMCTEALLRKPGRWEEPPSLSLVWRWPLGQWLSCGGLWMWGFCGGGSKDKSQPYEASEKTLSLQNFVWDNNGEQGDQTSQP